MSRNKSRAGLIIGIVIFIIIIITLVVLPLLCVYDLYGKCKEPIECSNGTLSGNICTCFPGFSGVPCKKDENYTEIDFVLKDLKFAYEQKPDSFKIMATWFTLYNDLPYRNTMFAMYKKQIEGGTTETDLANSMESLFNDFVNKKYGINSGTFFEKYARVVGINPNSRISLVFLNDIIMSENAYTKLKWT